MAGIEARVLNLVGDVSGLLELGEFQTGLLAALRAELPSDWVSLNQIAPDPEQSWTIADPPVPMEYRARFLRYALQNPLADHHIRTRDGRPLRFSDLVSPAQLHATDLYREVYATLGLEHQIAFTLPSPSERILAIALSRRDADFTDTERELLTLARPHLIQAYLNVLEFGDRGVATTGAQTHGPDEDALKELGLTGAQARVLRRIATGRSTADVAKDLEIAQRTVHKHLERIYGKLGVKDRSGAAAKAWQAVPRPNSGITPSAKV